MKSNHISILLTLLIGCLVSSSFGCSLFAHVSKDSVIVGRNFDWHTTGGTIWFIPNSSKGFGRMTITQLGIKMPYEGLNEQGLFVGQAMVRDTRNRPNIFHKRVRAPALIDKILRKCKTVEEAIKLASRRRILFGRSLGYPHIHYFFVDASGASAVLEIFDGKLYIFHRTGNNQIVSNNYWAENRELCPRYQIADSLFAKNNTPSTLFSIKVLEKISQSMTVWSNVYNLKKLKVYLRTDSDFSRIKALKLNDELSKGLHSYNFKTWVLED